jgi:hypothetical protein
MAKRVSKTENRSIVDSAASEISAREPESKPPINFAAMRMSVTKIEIQAVLNGSVFWF